MKDLRIVIVSWNVQEPLGVCLASLPEACEGLDWECVVVDNHSADHSVDIVKEHGQRDDRIDIIANKTNRGFAAACNQGAAHADDVRYILLLNPDTKCPAGSLKDLVVKADALPKVGIMGPKLVFPDGRYQPSAQRFPGVVDQGMIQLKLHHVFSGAGVLKRYFMQDLDNGRAQEVDQVMGACFLVRKACWDELGGLDERYFLWFEEVDACKTAKVKGWMVWYEPSVKVIHYGGEAFAKVFSWKRQSYFNQSLRKYMKKWHGYLAWGVVSLLSPIAMAMAGVLTLFKTRPSTKNIIQKISGDDRRRESGFRTVGIWLTGIIALEIISALAQGHTSWQAFLTVAAGVGIGILAFKWPAAGMGVVLAELMIGGFGYLLSLPTDIFARGVSLRMSLMAGYFAGAGLNALVDRVWKYWRLKEIVILEVWIFVLGMFIGGLIRGLQLGQTFIVGDANAWIFLLYLVPVLDVAHRFGSKLKKSVVGAALAALCWLPFKMLLVFYIFTHQLNISGWLYTWIRDTRVGEITDLHNGLYRVFFQSSVYSVLALGFLVAFWIEKRGLNKLQNLWPGLVAVLCGSAVLLGLSRSFWLGATISVLLVLVLGLTRCWQGSEIKFFGWAVVKSLAVAGVSLILVLGFWRVPIPHAVGGSVFDIFMARASVSDPAASSRWNLLPVMWQKIREQPILGSGLGGTLTYQSQDPRVLAQNPEGMVTTYAFEWGWLGFWIKFGIFGVLIMGWLMVSLAWRAWRSKYPWWLRIGILAGTACLVVIHFFTPYLDHPLGFAWIIGVEGMLAIKREELEPVYLEQG